MNEIFDNLAARDRALVWHPYSVMGGMAPLYPVVSANGVRIRLVDGTELIDGMASWWCAIHGYNHPRLNQAIGTQLNSMAHVMFGGLTHEPAVRLAERLVAMTPAPVDCASSPEQAAKPAAATTRGASERRTANRAIRCS